MYHVTGSMAVVRGHYQTTPSVRVYHLNLTPISLYCIDKEREKEGVELVKACT